MKDTKKSINMHSNILRVLLEECIHSGVINIISFLIHKNLFTSMFEFLEL